MSNAVRIALVGEGVTDKVVLEAAIESMLDGRSFVLTLLQPEGSVAFTGAGEAGPLGGGWKGVYKWCRQAAIRGGGSISGDLLFLNFDLLVVHLDADVGNEDPANHAIAPIRELAGQLPCHQPCPPASATTDPLRQVLLSWLGEAQTPQRTVLCTPSKCTEAWVMAVFFSGDKEMNKQGWECHPDPATRLAQQKKSVRFAKEYAAYEERKAALRHGWPSVAVKLSEAARFQADFNAALFNMLATSP